MAHAFTLAFTAIFVALDIVGTLPLYIGVTRDLSRKQRTRVINTSMLVAFIVAVAFIFVGQTVFRWLGITVSDFKIAGGIVLLLVALSDLAAGPEAVHRGSGSTGIVPLAVPLITGPGVLTQLILLIGTFGYFPTLLALVANYVLAWVILHKSETVARLIGKDGITVVSKIAALLLAAIAVAMIRTGVFQSIAEFRFR